MYQLLRYVHYKAQLARCCILSNQYFYLQVKIWPPDVWKWKIQSALFPGDKIKLKYDCHFCCLGRLWKPQFPNCEVKLVQKIVYDANSLPYSDPALLTFTLTLMSLWILSIYITVAPLFLLILATILVHTDPVCCHYTGENVSPNPLMLLVTVQSGHVA
jgi:hypothetical protein